MPKALYSVIGKTGARRVITLTLLCLPACLLLAPCTVRGGAWGDLQNMAGPAPNVPMPGNPTLAGFTCPFCRKFVDTPSGKMPTACPLCKHSFTQSPKPNPPTQIVPKLRPINPFGDSLFTNALITPDDGKLKTSHFDKDGLAAKAEAWGKEMKQRDTLSRQKQEAEAQAFERDKQALLKGQNGSARRQLKNVYANDNAWNGDSSVVDLRGKTNLTPQLLRSASGGASGSPINGDSSEFAAIRRAIEEGKYSHMNAEELDALARQYPENAEVQRTINRLKAQTKSMTALGDLSDQAARDRATMELEYDQAGRKGRETASKVLSLTTPLPDGLVSAAAGDKTWAQWAGVDATSYGVQEGYQYGAEKGFEKIVENSNWKTPVAGALASDVTYKGTTLPVGGVGGVIKGVSAVPDLIEMHQSATEGADHYIAAEELNAGLKASGGTVSAVNRWSTMRNQTLETSARLSQLIQLANQGTNAP
jgi:YD repeat-containing protein